MNYYQHHIGDFIRDTARLSDAQCMAYLRMIWMYYETELPLDNDADAIAFKIGANASDVHQILRHFFFEHEGKWHNSRCDKVILGYRGKSSKAKQSANARWENANAMRTQCERNANAPVLDANQEPITNNQEKAEKLTPSANAADPCPHQEIIQLYHDHLPMMPAVREWTPARQAKLRARWKEKAERQSLDWWAQFFAYVAESDFLCGRTAKPFTCNLEWLITPDKFAKVIEGNYENRGVAA